MRRVRRRASVAARSYLHAWLPRPCRPEPLTRRATSPPPRAPSGRAAPPLSPRVSRLQMGAPGTQGLSLFGGDPGAPPRSASASGLRQVHCCRGGQTLCVLRLGAVGGWGAWASLETFIDKVELGVVVVENREGRRTSQVSATVRPLPKKLPCACTRGMIKCPCRRVLTLAPGRWAATP